MSSSSAEPGGTSIPQEHDYEDSDRSSLAGHHTLGIHKYQGSPGNHTHRPSDPNSMPLFDGVEVDIEGLDTQGQLDVIFGILGDYGANIITTAPVVPPVDPTVWIGSIYQQAFTLVGSATPETTDINLQFSGEDKTVFVFAIDTDIANWAANGVGSAGGFMSLGWDTVSGQDAAFGDDFVSNSFTANVTGDTEKKAGVWFAFAPVDWWVLGTDTFTRDSWEHDGAGNTAYTISSAAIPNVGGDHQISLVLFSRLEAVDTTDTITTDIPAANVLESAIRTVAGEGVQYGAVVVDWSGTITFNEPVSDVSVLTMQLTV